jgi:DNA processing protein
MAQRALDFQGDLPARSVSPFRELGAYEALWLRHDSTFKRVADLFRARDQALPSDLVPEPEAEATAHRVVEYLHSRDLRHFGVRVHGAGEYPARLRDASHPVELLYYQGAWDLVESRCVAVVGTRKPTPEGVKRTVQLVRELVRDDWTIVSGLAAGIDTIAHTTALELGGRTIAIIGTPISETYPKENAELQRRIAREFLVVSQVPIERYRSQTWKENRAFFPERNVTMSALTEATIIVEAGNTSGTLIQARAALRQGRKLFILSSCFKNPDLTWPRLFAEKGATRVDKFDQIRTSLGRAAD